MYDQDSQDGESQNSQDGNLPARLNGLMSSLGKRTQERDQALQQAQALQAELDEMRATLDAAPEPHVYHFNPRKATPSRDASDPFASLQDVGWDALGSR